MKINNLQKYKDNVKNKKNRGKNAYKYEYNTTVHVCRYVNTTQAVGLTCLICFCDHTINKPIYALRVQPVQRGIVDYNLPMTIRPLIENFTETCSIKDRHILKLQMHQVTDKT